MKYLALFAALLTLISCSRPQPAQEPAPDAHISCPKITHNTPWNLDAKRGIDFWTCTYTYAVTDKPLFDALISNHIGTEPLEFYDFYPKDQAWFREVVNTRTDTRAYWTFIHNQDRVFGVTAIKFVASSRAEFKDKAAIAATLSQ